MSLCLYLFFKCKAGAYPIGEDKVFLPEIWLFFTLALGSSSYQHSDYIFHDHSTAAIYEYDKTELPLQ